METWLEILGGGIGVALLGVLGNIILQALQRNKMQAETGAKVAEGADSVVGSALSMVKEMRQDMASLKQRVCELEVENAQLKRTVAEQGEMIRRLETELAQYRAENCEATA